MMPTNAPSRADYLLATAGVALLAGVTVGLASSVPLQFAGAAGSLLAGIPIAHGLAHPP